MTFRGAIAGFAGLAALAAAGTLGFRTLVAADHLDPPLRTDPAADTVPDKAADIADIYLFYTATDLVLAMTFAGPQATTLPPTYDPDMLYTLHLSNDGDPTSTEFPIRVRFGYDGQLRAGVQVTGLPGGASVTGPVETDLQVNGISIRAGLFEDPFFFDLQGFRETRSSGTLAFNGNRDFFAGQNITGIVIQIPRAQIVSGNRLINYWAESARFGSQL